MELIFAVILIVVGYIVYKMYYKSRKVTIEYEHFAERVTDNDLIPMTILPEPKGIYSEEGIEIWWDESDSRNSKTDYNYGKNRYTENFGNLIGASLKNVIYNVNKLYKVTYYENATIDTMDVQRTIINMGRHYRNWDLWYNGGKYEISTGFSYENAIEEGFKSRFRRTTCKSEEIITDEELKDYFSNYSEDYSLLDNSETRLPQVTEVKRAINEIFGKPFRDNYYNKEEKIWRDFDINGVFLRVRAQMIDMKNPFPHYVWKLIPGDPFDRIYSNCRDYMKWKGTKRVTKLVFNNVRMWENGEIFREGEPEKEFEKPLWINWNKVGKNLLQMKTKLKKEDKGGIQWLSEEVGGYIKSRINFYEKFGKESPYYISKELISEYEKLM